MKRSEMEKIIAITLSKQAIAAGVSGLLWVDVKEILTKIEEAGMLPPETKALPSDFTNTGLSQEFLDEHEFKVNRWEPEDD